MYILYIYMCVNIHNNNNHEFIYLFIEGGLAIVLHLCMVMRLLRDFPSVERLAGDMKRWSVRLIGQTMPPTTYTIAILFL